jgi:hypothetical protein
MPHSGADYNMLRRVLKRTICHRCTGYRVKMKTRATKKPLVMRGYAMYTTQCRKRGVAQLASALRLGRRGPRFKSGHPDSITY